MVFLRVYIPPAVLYAVWKSHLFPISLLRNILEEERAENLRVVHVYNFYMSIRHFVDSCSKSKIEDEQFAKLIQVAFSMQIGKIYKKSINTSNFSYLSPLFSFSLGLSKYWQFISFGNTLELEWLDRCCQNKFYIKLILG